MLNFLWVALLVAGVAVGSVTGKLDLLNQTVFASARAAVMDIALPLVGTMCFWLGLMRLAERSGLIAGLARIIRPVMHRLFPEVPPADPAMSAMMMSIAANMLGVSNAATPLGLKAMGELSRLNAGGRAASNAMCMFLALNTSAVQLVPATAMNILAINGSTNPTAIIASTLLATATATACAIVIVKVLERLPVFARDEAAPRTAPLLPAPDGPEPSSHAAPVPARPSPLAPWATALLVLLGLLFTGVFVRTLVPALIHPAPAPGVPPFPITCLRALSPLVVPVLITCFPVYAAGRGVAVFTEFVEGAKEGFQIAVRIIPFLVGFLVAIGVFRDSGALQLLQHLLEPAFRLVNAPADLLPMILMRPLSGSGSIAVLSDVVKRFGPDHAVSYTAATIYGSAETTFYVVAVYFGSVNVTRTRHAIPAGLLADLAGIIAAIAFCRILFR
ncbi:MAG: nucleoside recognition protein [Verrucomicrobia bacterium]|nr:nucleoside recognition protein [Verrucomicrobiota bacterium]